MRAEATAAEGGGSRPAVAQAASPAPVLLPRADYVQTLAAVRSLHRAGVPVTVAAARWIEPARWSRFAARTLRCPSVEIQPERFLEWLLDLGAREPGQVLIATCDETAWLYARYRSELSRHFRLYLPEVEPVYALLNKWRLKEACASVGLETPATLLPEGEADLEEMGRAVGYPLLVKPQTQIFLWPHHKGSVVGGPGELAPLYRDLRSASRHAPILAAQDPRVSLPMLQAYVQAISGVVDVTGFVDETGELFVAVGARKILQKPRKLGIGLCFEEAEVAPGMAEKLAALCRKVGYHGVFDAEFIESDGRQLLIDFNPRLYGQLAFDVGRGLDLARLAYLGAVGDRAGLEASFAEARRAAGRREGRVYCNRIQLEIYLVLLRLTGSIGRPEARRWRRWVAEHRSLLTDAVLDPEDRKPGAAEAAASIWGNLRHLRSALRFARQG